MIQNDDLVIRREVARHCLLGEPYRGFKPVWCGDGEDKSLIFRSDYGFEIKVSGDESDEWRLAAWREVKVAIDSRIHASSHFLVCKTEESAGPWWLPGGKKTAQWKEETHRRPRT